MLIRNMPLTPEQISQLKNQLKEQIKNLPKEQKREAEQQIEEMSDEAIEEMLKQQKTPQKQIFRAIITGELPSKKIDENKEAIAVLDTRPLTKGHAIIIPKKPITDARDMPTQAFTLAKKVAKRVANKLKSKNTEIISEFKFGELVLNMIPIYDKPVSLAGQRQELAEPQLADLAQTLKKTERKIVNRSKRETKEKKLPQLPRRIP